VTGDAQLHKFKGKATHLISVGGLIFPKILSPFSLERTNPSMFFLLPCSHSGILFSRTINDFLLAFIMVEKMVAFPSI